MSTGNALQFSVGADIAPLKRDMAEAERVGTTGAAKVAKAMRSAGGSEKSSKGFETGFGKLDLFHGSSRLIRHVSLLVGAREVASVITEASEAQEKLNSQIEKASSLIGSGAFRGASELKSDIKEADSALEQLISRTRSEKGKGLFGSAVRSARQFITGDSDENENEQKLQLREKIVMLISQQAEKQEELNRATMLGLAGKQEESELAVAEIKHKEKLGELAAEQTKSGVDNSAGMDAENNRFAIETSGIHSKAALIKARADYEEGAKKAHEDSKEVRDKSARESLQKEARKNELRDKADRDAKEANEKTQRDYDDAKQARADFAEGQFQKFQQVNGDWSGYKQQQRDDRHARAVFDARQRDFAQRRANGAYGQTGPDAEVFGSNGDTVWMQKIYELIENVWGKN